MTTLQYIGYADRLKEARRAMLLVKIKRRVDDTPKPDIRLSFNVDMSRFMEIANKLNEGYMKFLADSSIR